MPSASAAVRSRAGSLATRPLMSFLLSSSIVVSQLSVLPLPLPHRSLAKTSKPKQTKRTPIRGSNNIVPTCSSNWNRAVPSAISCLLSSTGVTNSTATPPPPPPPPPAVLGRMQLALYATRPTPPSWCFALVASNQCLVNESRTCSIPAL